MNNEVTVMPRDQAFLDEARAKARKTLAQSLVFQSMSLSDQQDIYHSLVTEEQKKAMEKAGVLLAKPFATDSGKGMGFDGYNPSFGEDTKDFNDLVKSVDFPLFVSDLLKAKLAGSLNQSGELAGQATATMGQIARVLSSN